MTAGAPQAAPLDLSLVLVVETGDRAPVSEQELATLAQIVFEAEAAIGCWEVTVALVDDERLQSLHRSFMGIDSPTDVMTFPSDEANECRGGDVAISVDHALTHAAEWGFTPAQEIRFLVVHGLLHLLGWRDDSDTEREQMLARQHVLLDRWRLAMG